MALATMELPKTPVVEVFTTNGRGASIDEVADRCIKHLIHIADSAHPEVSNQAREFKKQIRAMLAVYLTQAAAGERTTIYNALKNAGQNDLAEMIRTL
jgi:hypothetical protein